ncbi:dicarboxylate/amino acid:cation symporter [Sansalvadorimonas sp. 2012CJ34-2]|uniref:Dicarboxylate/amino acid:cation symporter n=1 Tax=Parendozoicomonas callyspongiae TaxID=2942213 RepID=A0ABT0PHC4_9GAMM|nr:dicarboxylate/amino acid:cation symporter [Sansalvadorimonas sp. 2012CJ34-2]MCL6270782.1 dicarboxylate/amino acid:cation symporter [Sansalvadorimonas sp. 2012CJ34-2]
MSLTSKVVSGMVVGIVTGLLIRSIFPESSFIETYLTEGLFQIIGQIFIISLKMLVVPLIFVSLVCGTCTLNDASTLGRLGIKTIALYLITTCVAISMAIGAAIIVEPGVGANLESAHGFTAQEAPPLKSVLINLFPSNPIASMAKGNALQIIVFALLFGISIAASGAKGKLVADIFVSMNEVIMKLVTLLMNLAPYGVFALMARLFSTIEFSAILNLVKYFFLLVTVLILHVFITYFILIKFFARLNPVVFLRKMEDALLFAFSTSSSSATIPVTLETVNRKCGVSNRVSSFTIPLGATINMDGTAMMQGVATVFISQAFSIDLTVMDYLSVIVTATLASIGTAGVPGVGLIMLAMVLQQVGLPLEGIALIMGVDRLLDMVRTSVNVTGDCAVTCVVARSEGELDQAVFDDIHAGEKEETIDFHHITEQQG